MTDRIIDARDLGEAITEPLCRFFKALRESGDEAQFHPHPLNDAWASVIANYDGEDRYYLLMENREVIGYGMLRGWDEGFSVPSLGLAVRADRRHQGRGAALLSFLEAAARAHGASQLRLTVNADNAIAIRLYERHGFVLSQHTPGRLLGLLTL